jgi:hypothetical protein
VKKRKCRWRYVFGKPGQVAAYVEQRADGTFSVMIAGKLCGHFASEEMAGDFAQKIMATPDDETGNNQSLLAAKIKGGGDGQ